MDTLRYHRVSGDDTLAKISERYYGTPDYALVIYRHNTQYILNPNVLYRGQRLVIPHIEIGSVVLL